MNQPRKQPTNAAPEHRPLPTKADIEGALQKRISKQPPPAVITLIMKLHNLSSKKTHYLLQVHLYVTALRAKILRYFQEDPQTVRTDGSLALVLKHWQRRSHRSRVLGEEIRKLTNNPDFDVDPDQLFTSRIHEGVCHEVAKDLLNWAQDTIKFAIEEKKAQQAAQDAATASATRKKPIKRRRLRRDDKAIVVTLEEVYAAWGRAIQAYEQALVTIVPFSRYRSLTLKEVGKREARWLLERLLPQAELQQTLTYVESLLANGRMLTEDAVYAEHPYRRDQRYQRAVRANPVIQRILEPTGEGVILGLLKRDELEQFRTLLQDMIENGIALDAALPQLADTLHEAVQVAETFPTVQKAIETFLFERPPNYVRIVDVDEHVPDDEVVRKEYEARLAYFRVKRYGDNFTKFVSESRERGARERLLTAGKEMRLAAEPLALQPIPFISTMYPDVFRGFALLMDSETGEFVLALATRGKGNPVRSTERTERAELRTQQRRQGKLVFANMPHTPFAPSDQAGLELYPLTWGEQSKRRRYLLKRLPFLKNIIAYQAAAQEEVYRKEQTAGNVDATLASSPPPTVPFASARLVLRYDEDKKPEFYIHLSVKVPVALQQAAPQRVIGIHEHAFGYSYAVVDLDGAVCRDDKGQELVGDIAIPPHVVPQQENVPYSDNYVFEVANAIVRQASSAFIGIEDTGWRSDAPSLSRKQNRRIFGHPSARVRAGVESKALLAGLPKPWTVRNVSLGRDCGACQQRAPKGMDNLEREQVTTCPACETQQTVVSWTKQLTCGQCGHTWTPTIGAVRTSLSFRCRYCDAPRRPARINAAIVVAQETLRNITQADDVVSSEESKAA
jgi:hypothetical protein